MKKASFVAPGSQIDIPKDKNDVWQGIVGRREIVQPAIPCHT
jgi:hypothetical protein